VYIEFASRRLTEASLSIAAASRFFGVPIGRKYLQRLAVLRATDKFAQLYGLKALKLHQLKGDRRGEFAVTLTGNYRLILKRLDEDKVRVMDVEDYHGD
jgi:proteic killer suppression protein